jgi:hypothetical protein
MDHVGIPCDSHESAVVLMEQLAVRKVRTWTWAGTFLGQVDLTTTRPSGCGPMRRSNARDLGPIDLRKSPGHVQCIV